MTIRVLIADDQPVVRDGLAMLLGLIDDVEIVATAADGIEDEELGLTNVSCRNILGANGQNPFGELFDGARSLCGVSFCHDVSSQKSDC